ncbi:hypothetical protein B0T16DRAFT_455162 [Cercophora newfieldiana]|uniref:Uncharacterized protein n=1 Tax=Cercophora newfieldiana TaxID=92897 RepID=A0AA39YHP5_9PEZI|nr:hypothetical protein B0T16DRAFT_455162 [Cercophora newfieldiana]
MRSFPDTSFHVRTSLDSSIFEVSESKSSQSPDHTQDHRRQPAPERRPSIRRGRTRRSSLRLSGYSWAPQRASSASDFDLNSPWHRVFAHLLNLRFNIRHRPSRSPSLRGRLFSSPELKMIRRIICISFELSGRVPESSITDFCPSALEMLLDSRPQQQHLPRSELAEAVRLQLGTSTGFFESLQHHHSFSHYSNEGNEDHRTLGPRELSLDVTRIA